jgi:hypothetical protein
MNPTVGHRLDWKSQFEGLQTFLDGDGGVVHVYAGQGAPAFVFAKMLRKELAAQTNRRKSWLSMQIDPSSANTHYVSDIVSGICRTSHLTLDHRGGSPALINVGNGIKTGGGDVSIRDIYIGLDADPMDMLMREADLIQAMCEALSKKLRTQRLALILVNSHENELDNLTGLSKYIWDDALEKLIGSGLLLIDIFNPARQASRSSTWPPKPDLILDLPDRYDRESHESAKQDLVRIALEERLHERQDQAVIFADTLLALSDDVSDTYAHLAVALARLGTGYVHS